MTTTRITLGIIGGAAIAALCAAGIARPAIGDDEAQLRVGIFDSRAIAVAYANSEDHDRFLKGVRAEHERARADGNEDRVAEIEAEMSALQDLRHKQGFGTWPVDDVLERIEDLIPDIAADAGVDVIVNRWDLVYQAPAAEFVDVTLAMVAPFDPDERVLQIIEQMRNVAPLSIEEIEAHDH